MGSSLAKGLGVPSRAVSSLADVLRQVGHAVVVGRACPGLRMLSSGVMCKPACAYADGTQTTPNVCTAMSAHPFDCFPFPSPPPPCSSPFQTQELDVRAAQLAEEKHKSGGKNGEEGDAQSVSVFKFDQSRAPAFSDDQIERDSELAAGERCCWVLRCCSLLGMTGRGKSSQSPCQVTPDALDLLTHQHPHSPLPPSLPGPDLGGALGSGGLLGSLGSLISTLESVSGATSGSDEEGKNGGGNGGRIGGPGPIIDVDAADVVSMLASTDLEGGDVPNCPDGSEECPIPWEAMVSGEEQPADQPAAAASPGNAAG